MKNVEQTAAATWSDDLRETAGGKWKRSKNGAKDRDMWFSLKKAYFQQQTNLKQANDDAKIMTNTGDLPVTKTENTNTD